MFKFIKKLFDKKPEIKKYSTTETEATEGSNSKADLNPEIKEIVSKLTKKDKISNNELNKLIEFYFNKAPIVNHLYKLNDSYTKGMCFSIDSVNTVSDEQKDICNIVLTMNELTFNAEINISISIKDFHEFFSPVSVQPVITER